MTNSRNSQLKLFNFVLMLGKVSSALQFSVFICLLLVSCLQAHGQDSENYLLAVVNAEKSQENANYSGAIQWLKKAISEADNEWSVIDAKIRIAELLRKFVEHEKAFKILWSINMDDKSNDVNQNWLALKIRRFGRLAALHNESSLHNTTNIDSTSFYIDTALVLCEINPYDFQEEIASLKNESAFRLNGLREFDKARRLYSESASIYQELGEKQNYLDVLNNLLTLEIVNNNEGVADSIIEIVKEISEDSEWFQSNIYTYENMAHLASLKGDSLSYWKYKYFQHESYIKYSEQITEEQILQLREGFETAELKNELYMAERDKEDEEKSRRKFTIYFILAGLLSISVILILLRERRLKKQVNDRNNRLQQANEKYQMLVTESNHRIKNNLQMMLSMLDYETTDLNQKELKALSNISGKIQTISALHRHLHFDIHNEKVPLSVYFNEIIDHYQSINNHKLPINFSTIELEMNSEQIIYFGLILNELLSNTLKHNETADFINISIVDQLDKMLFRYSDGAILPENMDSGTGIELVIDLVERLEGDNFKISKDKGLFEFSFKA